MAKGKAKTKIIVKQDIQISVDCERRSLDSMDCKTHSFEMLWTRIKCGAQSTDSLDSLDSMDAIYGWSTEAWLVASRVPEEHHN